MNRLFAGDWKTREKWVYSQDYEQICQIIEGQTLWGETTCRVWLPRSDSVVRMPASRLKPLESVGTGSPDNITYVAAAARVADALTQDILLAPIESSVIPLPHQIRALSQAISNEQVRYLLADEVGLGKTIEAGLIMRELKLRGKVSRTLVVAPKGLVTQWVSEMHFHFNEPFRLLLPEDLKTLGRLGPIEDKDRLISGWRSSIPGDDSGDSSNNPWRIFPQVVVPMDSVKPMDQRRRWSAEQVAGYNRERFEDLISAGWDMVIIDEAHRLGGATDQVARFKLGQGLSEAAPYLLLLSATPHQGKTDSFHRLMSIVDAQAFPDIGSVSKDRVQAYVIRTEKREAIDAEGNPLFKPRKTELAPVSWKEQHRDQKILYEAVTEYVREGYNQAVQEKRSYIGFLMILMQRLVVSSTRAIRSTLEKRLEILASPQEQMELFPQYSADEWSDLDGQEQMEALLRTRLKALKNERAEVKLLLEAAARCERTGPDAKAGALLDWLYKLQAEEGDPDLKVLVFTEFVPTQEMLRQFLTERGFSVVCLNGSMDMEDRARVQNAFAGGARILLSTDAGGEGLNLQFCHVVINYDIPWNPMRLEQRIGRVDRIGQSRKVRAVNFVFEDSVEHRIQEVLEQKLSVIFEEFGIDKTGDVLDSAHAGKLFDDLYVKGIRDPDRVEESVDQFLDRFRQEARAAGESASLLGKSQMPDPGEAQRLMAHPLPHWVERMTVSHIRAAGGSAERKGPTWCLTWPDGKIDLHVVFSGKDQVKFPAARLLTLEAHRIRELTERLPLFVSGQPIPVVNLPGLSSDIKGIWSLWQITLSTAEGKNGRRQKILPLFLSDSNKVFGATARHVWDRLLDTEPVLLRLLSSVESVRLYQTVKEAAEQNGKPLYDALLKEHCRRLSNEREKARYLFSVRKKRIERIGLPEVRNFRLKRLEDETAAFQHNMENREQVYPEISALAIVMVGG